MTGHSRCLPGLDVSRETLDRLIGLEEQIVKWNASINLVSRHTLGEIWQRHILDSAQVYRAAPPVREWLDLGSGGGFPGLVIAIIARELRPDMRVTLIDSDRRKCVFLRTIAREAQLNARILAGRIEETEPQAAGVISARALAPLGTVLAHCARHLRPDGIALLQKGENWQPELEAARTRWHFEEEVLTSETESRAVILKIRNITRV